MEPGDPAAVPVTRVTVTAAAAAASAADAATWVERVSADPAARVAEVSSATQLVNRALGALRAGAADPLVQDVGATRALAIRIGYGSGEELAAGTWSAARQLPPPRRGRLDDVDSQTRVAAVLAGRDSVSPAETLLLRARLDLAAGRSREAALQLPDVARGLLAEGSARDAAEREELESLLPELDDAARGALAGELAPEQAESVRRGVELARTLTAPG